MRLLAIETATAACSVALFDDGVLVDFAQAIVGRGHAERLLPMIADLVGGGRADGIVVDIGPGSFTGIRVGIAAARALAFGWGVPAQGYGSLALIAALDGADSDSTIAIEGGHGEVFVARHGNRPMIELEAPRSVAFELAVGSIATARIVGSAAHRLVEARGFGEAVDIAPDARGVVLLPDALKTLPPIPFYGRGADAKPLVAA